MTDDEARKMIETGLAHDEAMSKAPWNADPHGGVVVTSAAGNPTVVSPLRDASGIAWLRTHARAILEGWRSALEERDRLRAEIADLAKSIDDAYVDDGWYYVNRLNEILDPKP